jgi:hypothetical protein
MQTDVLLAGPSGTVLFGSLAAINRCEQLADWLAAQVLPDYNSFRLLMRQTLAGGVLACPRQLRNIAQNAYN